MSRIHRVAGMILLFLLLASGGISASASAEASNADRDGLQHTGGPGVSLQRDEGGWEDMPALPSPAWGLSPPASVGANGGDAPPIDPELMRVLLEAESDQIVPVIVDLHGQANLGVAVDGALSATDTRVRIVSALQANAARSQAPLQAYLEGALAAGRVESYTPFWIFNGIALRAQPSAIQAIAANPAVASVRLDHWRRWVASGSPRPRLRSSEAQSGVEWGVDRIRADEVWSMLHISGTGALVAGMDTGVDWLHPALQANYVGYNPHGPANHTYGWYDATSGGARYPVDGHGHGSHTLGTVVGQGGIGVAPGARWIAVRVLDNQGYGYDSWIHAGFQWLLAPGGDPARAPDVVNCSWGNPYSGLTIFQDDLRALQAAGVLAVFSSGNSGPYPSSVGSPASLPEAFAVGATDDEDDVANFSSRGPSPWGEIRPHVVAPGVDVVSSLPGGATGSRNGTSMAAPHVSGVVALLRSVSPTLSITRALAVITSTAVPLGVPYPNNDAGWGRVDAFAALAALVEPGFISGTVVRAGDGQPVAGATVAATPHGGAEEGSVTTDGDGAYRLVLAPTTYDLTASAFGYEPVKAWGVVVTTGTTALENFSLTPLPSGTLKGSISDAATGHPVIARVSAEGTPVEARGDTYTFTLPVGTYTLRARCLGFRIVTTTAVVRAGQVAVADLALPPAPSILLVDSGAWYYGSQARYFRQALDELRYAYDEWDIKQIPDGVPAAADLIPYDVVVWSAPEDAPGYIGAESAVTGYLSSGGRMLLTGQDVGFWDDGGSWYSWSPYYREYLKVRYLNDDAPARVLDGTQGDLFSGLTITITGAGGADNQGFPDEIKVLDPDAAAPVLTYRGSSCGGVRVGTCLDYRVIYLSFGFEAINDRAMRREVMGRAIDWLMVPPPRVGLELTPDSQLHIGLPGSVVTHTVRVRHLGQEGVTESVDLTVDGASWATRLSSHSLSLDPCASNTVVVSVTVPSAAGWNAWDVVTLTARSAVSPTLTETAVLTTKAPAPVLLVDDERWYDHEDRYETALSGSRIPYDYWCTELDCDESDGSPIALDVLRRYPIVVWFTGYDWYEPVTAEEEAMLAAYLDGGGRLFLSSQDFLYYHHSDSFSREALGVITYTESVTSTLAWGVLENLVGDRLGPYSLVYPFYNGSDAIVPLPGTAVAFRDQERRPIAVARQTADHRTVFLSFPFETLPEAGRVEVMERAVGWLSWLGGSTFRPDRSSVSGGDVLTYTAVLRNDGMEAVSASFSNTLPSRISMMPDSLRSRMANPTYFSRIANPTYLSRMANPTYLSRIANPTYFSRIANPTYQASTGLIFWEGWLNPGAAITFTYQVTVAADVGAANLVTSGETIANVASLGLEGQGIRFRRPAVVRVDAPDLSPSGLECGPSPARPGAVVTCTLGLANAGPGNAPGAVVTTPLPMGAVPVPGSLDWMGGGAADLLTGTVRWAGSLSSGGMVTLSYQLTLPASPVHPPLYNVAFLEDGTGGAWERTHWILIDPLKAYLPLVMRGG